MKVLVLYEPAGVAVELHHKLSISLPAKWLDQSVDKVKELFIGAYNKKFAASPLEQSALVLEVKDSSPFTHRDTRVLRSSDTPASAFEDRGEVRVVPPPAANGSAAAAVSPGCLRCKNYGCQCEFKESENGASACRHHAGAPVFHDTRKWWSCCENTKVYSFDELMSIPGCVTGPHRTEAPAAEVRRQESLSEATSRALRVHEAAAKPDASGRAPPPQQSFTPSAPPPSAPKRKKPREVLPAGQARCKHFGCQMVYTLADNGPRACTYHTAAPLFHEGSKKWPCCNVKKWDFDEFMMVPGCQVGEHEPVELE